MDQTLQQTTQETNTQTIPSAEIKHESTLYAEPITYVHGWPITNSLITSWFAVLIIAILSLTLRANMKKVPGKLQHLFEIILDGALNLADQVTGDRKITKKIFPLAICIFFFVLINNWLGLLPLGGLGVVQTGAEGSFFVPFLRSGTADINTTMALALIAVIGSNIFGAVAIGVWKTFNKYVNLKALAGVVTKVRKEPTTLVIAPVMFFVGALELVGEVAKVASLSFRLFGNVFAGEVLLASMSAIIAYGLPVPFMFLEIIVGVIQALIISMLVLVYFTIAAQDHDEPHEHAPNEGFHEHMPA